MKTPQFAGDDTVSLIVGTEDNKRIFVVHKSFLTHYSAYFKTAFTGDSNEAITGIMRLEDVAQNDIEELVGWVYSRRLKSTDYYDSVDDLARLWLLGGQYMMPKFQNAVMTVLWRQLQRIEDFHPSQVLLESVYKSARGSNPLKDILVHTLAHGPSYILQQCFNYNNKEFWLDLVMELKEGKPEDLALVWFLIQGDKVTEK